MAISNAEKSARYRAKDVEAYRKRKAELARTEKHREQRREYMRKWREKNREKHNQLAKESHKRNRHKHVEKRRDHHLLKTYGFNYEQKRQMIESQNGLCKICSLPFKTDRQTHVDHDHTTGAVRGILCGPCNTRLGWFEKYTDSVTSYLTKENA